MKKRLMVGLMAGGLMAAMLPGVASAAAPTKLTYSKSNEKCTVSYTVISFYGPVHWSKDFNPSKANAFWRVNDCGAPDAVDAGANQIAD